jgi:hypothetical protein
MKQKPGSHNCIAVVAAMATDSTPEEFEDFTGSSPPYSDYDFYRFLLSKGYVTGVGVDTKMSPIEDGILNIHFETTAYPALVVVKSETYKDKVHVIYWDGSKVHDPHPNVKDGRPLSDYEIHLWFPINKVDIERKLT